MPVFFSLIHHLSLYQMSQLCECRRMKTDLSSCCHPLPHLLVVSEASFEEPLPPILPPFQVIGF